MGPIQKGPSCLEQGQDQEGGAGLLVVRWDEQEEPHIPGELSKGHSQSQPHWPTATVMTSRAAHRFKCQLGVAGFRMPRCFYPMHVPVEPGVGTQALRMGALGIAPLWSPLRT